MNSFKINFEQFNERIHDNKVYTTALENMTEILRKEKFKENLVVDHPFKKFSRIEER